MNWADVVAGIQDGASTLAIIVGGIWTYLLFIKRRQRFPRAELMHEITLTSLPTGHTLLRADLVVKNAGEVLLSMKSARTRVQQILPIFSELEALLSEGKDPVPQGNSEIAWPLVGVREWNLPDGATEIEPGETEALTAEFAIDRSTSRVLVYSYVTNLTKSGRNIGWSRTTFVDLPAIQEGKS